MESVQLASLLDCVEVSIISCKRAAQPILSRLALCIVLNAGLIASHVADSLTFVNIWLISHQRTYFDCRRNKEITIRSYNFLTLITGRTRYFDLLNQLLPTNRQSINQTRIGLSALSGCSKLSCRYYILGRVECAVPSNPPYSLSAQKARMSL